MTGRGAVNVPAQPVDGFRRRVRGGNSGCSQLKLSAAGTVDIRHSPSPLRELRTRRSSDFLRCEPASRVSQEGACDVTMTRWIIAMIVCWATLGHASTKRVAVIVGNNTGGADQTPLRYAETDAGKLARVLTELGGVAPDDLFLVQGKNLAALTEAFTLAKRRIAGFRADPTNRVIVLFYFSGHSDGEALELGRDRLTYSELRRWLAAAGADVRVALVDSCKSGALLTAKGGTPGPAFQIRLTDDLASTGEALLTSSAADEVALESREIGGSFFTHHFISGLRGAADTSGDGLVTLAEAYQYAYAHTLKTTGETIVGPQHPAYNYQLSGQGELVLAELSKPSGALELPKGFDRILVIDLARDQVIAEVTSDAHGVIAVQPGRYAVRAWRDGKTVTGRVTVALGETRSVRSNELATIDTVSTSSKGSTLEAGDQLFVAAGGERGVANDVGLVPGLRVELNVPSGVSLALTAGSRFHAGYRESSSLFLAGYRRGIERDRYAAWAGAEAGAGVVVQSSLRPDAYSGELAIGAFAGGALRLARRWSFAVEATLPAAAIRRDGKMAIVTLPAAWFGVVVSL
jgi:hypothetical protein